MAIDFYSPDEIQGKSYVSVFEYCQNTTTTSAYWDPFGWWTSENTSYYFSCWDFEYNATAPTTWYADTVGLDFASPIDEVLLSLHPVETATYGKFSTFADGSDLNWDEYSFVLPANKEAIVYLSYSINNTTYFDQSKSSFNIISGSYYLDRNQTLPTTAGTYHNISLFSDVDRYNDRNITVTFNLFFKDLEAPVKVIIDSLEVFTYDQESPFVAQNFTTSYGLSQCNASLYQFNENFDDRKQVFAVNDSTGYRGVGCAVYLYDNITFTRRAKELTVDSGSSSPPKTSPHVVISSRDKAFVKNTIGTAGADLTTNPMIFTQIQPHALRLYFQNTTLPYTEQQLKFSDSGLINLSTLYFHCNSTYDYDAECTFELTASGDEYFFDWSGAYGQSDNQDVFSVSYCEPRETCTFGSLYFLNADCSLSDPFSCGVWGCNGDGDACNLPTNPENASEIISEYGSYCFENNDYSYYTLNATGLFVFSCTFPQECRQPTDITISCATDSAWETSESQSDLPSATAYGIAQTLGVEMDTASLLFSIIVTLLGAFTLTMKVKDNHANVFFAVVIVGLTMFYYLEMVPFSLFAFIILGVAGLWFLVYRNISGSGG